MSGYIERVENKRASENGWAEIKDWGTSVNFYWGFKRIQFKLYTYVVAKTLQNGAVYPKTDSWFQKPHKEFQQLQASIAKSKRLKFDSLFLSKKYIPLAETLYTEELSNINFNYSCENLPNSLFLKL